MSFNGDVLTDGTQEVMMKAHEDAEVIWRRIVKSTLSPVKKKSGAKKKKLQRFEGRKTTAKATKSKGRASAVKLKKTMEHMLSKERHNVLSYFLKGGQSSPEQRTEAILSVGSVVPRALVN